MDIESNLRLTQGERDTLMRRTAEMDCMEDELERLRVLHAENSKMRDQKRDDDLLIQNLQDKLRDNERQSDLLRMQVKDQEIMLQKFVEEVRHLD